MRRTRDRWWRSHSLALLVCQDTQNTGQRPSAEHLTDLRSSAVPKGLFERLAAADQFCRLYLSGYTRCTFGSRWTSPAQALTGCYRSEDIELQLVLLPAPRTPLAGSSRFLQFFFNPVLLQRVLVRSHLGLADKCCAFLDDQSRCMQVTNQR
jgi:hypothetical protein